MYPPFQELERLKDIAASTASAALRHSPENWDDEIEEVMEVVEEPNFRKSRTYLGKGRGRGRGKKKDKQN